MRPPGGVEVLAIGIDRALKAVWESGALDCPAFRDPGTGSPRVSVNIRVA
jgi:hypothetical protein